MKEIEFIWDEDKNQINIKKHGIDFNEAMTVFYDTEAIVFDDPDHPETEERFLILGLSLSERLCIVSHCYRGNDDIIRIISARKATKRERETYNAWNGGN